MGKKPRKEKLEEWHNDPKNWVGGIFYFNKEDKRLFPPKRIAFLGYTVNFANPYSILALAVIAFVIVVIGRVIRG